MNAALKTVDDWLGRIEALHPSKMELGLDRVRQVADRLGVLSFSVPVITVAGTNGKGSTVKSLEQLLMHSGHRVACYTSPHLRRYNERIAVNNNEISDDDLVAAFEQVDAARDGVALTYFEFGTLAALWYFRQQRLDYVILEIGLGGRLDACNVVPCDLAIITTVDLDHQAYLGDTIEAIAYEKAGIVQRAIPVVFGDDACPVALKVVSDQCERHAARLYALGEDYHYDTRTDACESAAKTWAWQVRGRQVITDLPIPPVHLNSVAAALMAAHLLGVDLSNTVNATLSQLSVPARLHCLQQRPDVVVDVAHNPQAARYLAQHVIERRSDYRHCYAVVGMMADKDHERVFAEFQQVIDHWWAVDVNEQGRHFSAESMKEVLTALQLSVEVGPDVPSALAQAMQRAGADDLVLVFGSFSIVGQVVDTFNKRV